MSESPVVSMPGAVLEADPNAVSSASLPRSPGRLSYLAIEAIVLDHALPASVWLILLLAKLTTLRVRLETGMDWTSFLSWAYLAQEIITSGFTALMGTLLLVRRPVIGRKGTIHGRVLALAGTFILFVPVASQPAETQPWALVVSAILILAGMILGIVSLATLGRCFGLSPEARGLVTWGPYRYVRHPIYLGEITAALGLVVASRSWQMASLVLLLCAFQFFRSMLEERALVQVFPEYEDYRKRTWRVIPGIF